MEQKSFGIIMKSILLMKNKIFMKHYSTIERQFHFRWKEWCTVYCSFCLHVDYHWL